MPLTRSVDRPVVARRVVAALFCAGALFCASLSATADTLFSEGDPLPDTYLRSLEGGPLQSLRSLRGRKTLLIHFASW